MDNKSNVLRARLSAAARTGALLLVAACAAPAWAQDAHTVGNVDLYLGGKTLDSNDWSPADHEGEAGLGVDFKEARWPVSVELGILAAGGRGTTDGATTKSATSEVFFGARKIWDGPRHVRPFLDAGLALVDARLQTQDSSSSATVSQTDAAGGVWLGGGVYWTLEQVVNIGLAIRFTGARVALFGEDRDAGGAHLDLTIGMHWGGRSDS